MASPALTPTLSQRKRKAEDDVEQSVAGFKAREAYLRKCSKNANNFSLSWGRGPCLGRLVMATRFS